MAKYYRRKFYRKRKYNIENKAIRALVPTNRENGYFQNQIPIVPPTTTEGVRKVTRFTITLTAGVNYLGPIYWALVYIPEGAVTSSLFPVYNQLFNPSNYVLASGVSDVDAGPIRISSRIQKNLNANDQIFLLTAASYPPEQGVSTYIQGLVRYAISYN